MTKNKKWWLILILHNNFLVIAMSALPNL